MSRDDFRREDYEARRSRQQRAFREIARQLGEAHAITKMMGTRAWGRHPFEGGPEQTAKGVIYEVGAFDGAFDILNLWARDHDSRAQQIMVKLWPFSWAREKEEAETT